MGRALGHDEQRGCTIESIGVRTRAGEANADERGRSTSRDPAHRAVPAQLEIARAQCAPTGASHSICDAAFRLRVAARRPNACRATSLGAHYSRRKSTFAWENSPSIEVRRGALISFV